MIHSRDGPYEGEACDKPPTIDSEGEDDSGQNKNHFEKNVEETQKEEKNLEKTPNGRKITEDSPRATTETGAEPSNVIAANANASSTTEVTAKAQSSRNRIPSSGSSTAVKSSANEIVGRESSTGENLSRISKIRMNANESRRSNEYLSEQQSEVFIGKADLNLTEGALSVDELDDNQVRLSWRANSNKDQVPASAYIIESKTKSGFWREICRVSVDQTEIVLKVEAQDQLKFRIKAAETEDVMMDSTKQGSVKDLTRKLNEASIGSESSEPSTRGSSKAASPVPTTASDSKEEEAPSSATPAWKQKLIDKKMEQMKQKEDEEEMARRKWSELPDWKKKLLETKDNSKEELLLENKKTEDETDDGLDNRERINASGELSDDSASGKSAGFWGVKLKKQRSKVSSVLSKEDEEEGEGNYKEGAKRLWGISLKMTEKGECTKEGPS